MPSLRENLSSRVRKLLKPSNAQQALQPVLEAMSNSVMAIDERFETRSHGRVSVEIKGLGSSDISVTVEDNGIGLDERHYEAFLEVDTEFKKDRGGKGVGRLYWLDAFTNIEVQSQYLDRHGSVRVRAFKFVLGDDEQIQEIAPTLDWNEERTGTIIKFRGLRSAAYIEKFPKQAAMVVNHTASEFIADFLSRNSPRITLSIETRAGAKTDAAFPDDVADLVALGPVQAEAVEIEGIGDFDVTAFLCDKRASRGMKLKHAVHLLGNGRTVESRKIDDLLGINDLEHEGQDELRVHLVVGSEFLDARTAESRTAFTIPEGELSDITRSVVTSVRNGIFAEKFRDWDKQRRFAFDQFLADQPIYAFSDPDDLFENQVPPTATTPEQFVRSLSVVRMRREQERELTLGNLVGSLVTGGNVPENFSELVARAAKGIQANEMTSLAHHAARRKVVLDLLDKLIRRVRETDAGKADKHHLERTLHSLLVPMQLAGWDHETVERSSHDLWILDERLTYTAGFSSDLQLRRSMRDSESEDRPDVLVWDVGFGLGPISVPYGDDDVNELEPLQEVFVVELKKPGRKEYGPNDRVEDQLTKYIREIRAGEVESFGRRKIRVSNDCRFYCLVIADIEGQLKNGELSSWEPIDNGRGRRRELRVLNAIIDVFEWSEVLRSARDRNRALLSMAGLSLRADTAFERRGEAAAE
ncbi:MAG: ATP-binding protein [Pseudomonadota bacterium]